MKKLLTSVLLLSSLLVVFSCGESSKERAQRELIDSLEIVNNQVNMDYEDLQSYLSVIAEGLDSISIEETELLANNTPGENMNFNRQRMKQDLDRVRDILSRHRDRIDELEKKLDENAGNAKYLRTIITALRKQLDDKDRELTQLKADLEDNKKSIALLSSKVMQISQENQEQAQTIENQQQIIEQQNESINKGYIKIASSKELKDAGLLSGGFLKKKKVQYSNIDLSMFETVDMRTFRTITLPKKAKILTNMPQESYTIENGKNSSVLTVIDPAKFWSVSNFLIIQTN